MIVRGRHSAARIGLKARLEWLNKLDTTLAWGLSLSGYGWVIACIVMGWWAFIPCAIPAFLVSGVIQGGIRERKAAMAHPLAYLAYMRSDLGAE